jgi:phage tail sheath protein FI
MAFLVSPGVQIVEKDLTNIIPAVATSIGGFAGKFEWGPALDVTTVTSEKDLIAKFGYPKVSTNDASSTRDDWYAAANFLGYANNLQVVRAISDGARNAASEPVVGSASTISAVFTGTPSSTVFTSSNAVAYDGATTVAFTADALTLGSIADAFREALVTAGVSSVTIDSDAIDGITDPTVKYSATGVTLPSAQTINGVTITFFVNTDAEAGATTLTSAQLNNLDDFLVEKTTLVNGSVYARYPGALGNGIGVFLIDASIVDSDFKNSVLFGTTKGADLFDTKPGTSTWGSDYTTTPEDEMHIIVYTTDTTITGSANEVLETYAYVSKAKNAKTADGGPNFYVDIVNDQSQWIYLLNEETAAQSGTITGNTTIGSSLTSLTGNSRFNYLSTNMSLTGVRKYDLDGGTDGASVSDANYTTAYDLLKDDQAIDVNLLITGERSATVSKYIITIAETRKDAIAFCSPSYSASVNNPTAQKVIDYFSSFNSSSYAVFDSGYKRQYDRYNDEYFWMPLNPDTAGLTARAEFTNDAWFSPAGLNRGFINNVVKLSFNPNQTERDQLYPNRINPVVTFRGQGTLLYGDKTALSRPSAFDRINVRRLFIVLEKAIATAAKFQLFEFNDDLTRRTFVNAVEPFLAEIQARRGLTDFKVVCDTSNNTGQVIDGNRFVADIYIKPARSINFITLNFIAVRTGVSFSEVAGA